MPEILPAIRHGTGVDPVEPELQPRRYIIRHGSEVARTGLAASVQVIHARGRIGDAAREVEQGRAANANPTGERIQTATTIRARSDGRDVGSAGFNQWFSICAVNFRSGAGN